MPSLYSLSPLPPILSLFFLATLSQNPAPPPCIPRLLPLLPCVPFVQGIALNPSQHCCDGLEQLYSVQPQCLCLLLNNTSLASSFPINATLALRLPSLCSLHVDNASCSVTKAVSPSSPASEIFLGRNTSATSNLTNSTFAASPAVEMAPRPSSLGLAFGKSNGVKRKANHEFKVMTCMALLSVVML